MDALIEKLEHNSRLGYITIVDMPGESRVKLYNYTRKTTFEGAWNEWTCRSRGLIIDLEKKQIVACPFPKFFNYEELPKYNSGVPKQSQFEVFPPGTIITEKMDGSLGILFYFGSTWHVCTRGSFTSSQAIWAMKWLTKHNILKRCTPGITYLFEIIYPENKIVIDYGTEMVILLGAYDSNGVEIIDLDGLATGLDLAPRYHFSSAAELLKVCDVLPPTKEGYVVRLLNGQRCKFKGKSYNIVHKLRSGFAPALVWKHLLERVPNAKESLPEEFYDEYDQIRDDILQKLEKALTTIRSLGISWADTSKKEIGLNTVLDGETKSLIFLTKVPEWETLY